MMCSVLCTIFNCGGFCFIRQSAPRLCTGLDMKPLTVVDGFVIVCFVQLVDRADPQHYTRLA